MERYDFRQPGSLPGDSRQFLNTWQRMLCKVVVERWVQEFSLDVKWDVAGGVDVIEPARALESFPEESIGFQLRLIDDACIYCVFPNQLLLAICDVMLGGTSDSLPEPRELTSVEFSLAEMAIRELAMAYTDAWPGADSIPCGLVASDPKPRRTKLFANENAVVLNRFQLVGRFGEQEMAAIISLSTVDEVVPHEMTLPGRSENFGLAQLVQEMPVRIVARLGEATIPISQLFELKPGDVMILDQRVTEPISVCVEDQAKFQGWPGRIGHRQAVLLQSPDDAA